MPEETYAKVRRRGLENRYDPTPLTNRIRELVDQHNESYRQAAMSAGLDHQAVRRIINGLRPTIPACVLLANHWKINPNELLMLAGWPALDIFSIETASADKLPPEAVDVALAVAKIADPGKRKQVSDAILTLLEKYFEA